MKTTFIFFLVAIACVLSNDAVADIADVAPATTSITERVASDGTRYYSVEISLSENLNTVSHAWLELRADVSARNLNGFVDPAPVFEVYALKRALSGDPEQSDFEATRIPMSRPVATGTDRLLKIDVTEFVRLIVADPSKNHGLVVGPLTNDKRGVFVVKEDGIGPGQPARVRILE